MPLNVVREMTETLCYHHAEVSDSILKRLGEKGIDRDLIDSVKDVFNCQTQTEVACNELNTEYKFKKYIRDNFGLVSPVQYNLSNHRTSRKNGKYQYVPILQTLKKLLEHDDVFSFVMNNHQSSNGIYRDYCDGEYYKKKKVNYLKRRPTLCK